MTSSTTRIYDLSHPVHIGTSGFPTCARILGWPMREISWSNYNMLHISTDLHTGTHLDAMLHCMPNGLDAAALPLEHCVGPAAIVDLTAKGIKGATFAVEDFSPHSDRIRKAGKLLVKTGWAAHWNTAAYHDQFPGFSREAAEYLGGLGVHLVGMEQASVHPTDHLEVHRAFFRRNIIIVEGLANLTQIQPEIVEFFAVPLRFEGADGSLVRAFCRC
jgi:arylformamidase